MKGLAIKLGDQQQASICYDTELLRVSCGWTGGFLQFSPSRFGLIAAPAVQGAVQFSTPQQPGCTSTGRFEDTRSHPPFGPLPRDAAHYEGLFLHGNRVVLQYTVGSTHVLESPWVETAGDATIFTREWEIAAGSEELRLRISDGQAQARLIGPTYGATLDVPGKPTIAIIPPRTKPVRIKLAIWNDAATTIGHEKLLSVSPQCLDLQALIQPGAPRWGEPLVTRGEVSSKADPYVIDTLTIPFDNRYKALMFASGHDFFTNGDAAVCTAHGDVWLVSGLDEKLERITWRRFATGLFQPLGLKIVKRGDQELVYVLGRDQISILHDSNRDGEADFYENFNNEGQVTANAHEFATCLETDSQGNFYYLKGDSASQTDHDGCLLRVTPDGRRLDVFASGFRNANGMSIGPDDTITVAPQEGTWTPGSAIFQVRQGGFYGAMQSHHRASPPTTYEPPICWIPRLQDNSSGGQTWVTSDRWGPLQGQLLHFSFGTCRMMLTLREAIGDKVQGGTLQFPLLFDSGVMRGRFHPRDGQLYVTGLKGWVSSAVQDGCFQRVRYTGRPVDLPVRQQTFSNGITLTFTEPLDRDAAEDPDNFGVEAWNYLWSGNYGSPDLKVSNPGQVGHDEIEVVSATLLPDGKSVFLELPELQPAMQVSINCTLTAKAGRPIQQTYFASIQQLGTEPQPEQLTRKARPGQLPLEVEQALRPGLVLNIFQSANGTATRKNFSEQGVSRLAAYYAPRSLVEKVLGTSGPVQAQWKGYLKIPQKGEYQFRIESPGKVRLQIGDHDVALNSPVALRRGYQPLTLEFSNPQAEIGVRLLWRSANFPWEAVPPQTLFHRHDDARLVDAQNVRAGRDVYRNHGCGNCHASQETTTAVTEPFDSKLQAPALEQLGGRLNGDWIAAWIRDPQRMRHDATMPRFFHGVQGADAVRDRQSIADLVAFLTSTHGPAETKPANDNTDDTDAGLQLYESQGCMGCHRFTSPETADSFNRVSLHFVSAKFREGQLGEFLRNPRKHSPQIRMPDFRFTESESRSLEKYLRSMATGQVEAATTDVTGDAQRGAKIFEATGCRNCHQLNSTDQRQAKKILAVVGKSLQKGCVADKAPAEKTQPHYQLTDSDRASLDRFLQTASPDTRAEFDIERTQRVITRLNCRGCHSRDGDNSPLAEILSEEGQGLPPEALPQLTWAGEKLRTNWIDRLLHGRLAYQSRPWLKARMPSFPANQLGRDLAQQHGICFDAPVEVFSAPSSAIDLGHQLTLKGQGLDCRQCHGVGEERPAGDHATLISIGINFSVINDRLNPEFFPRLLMNPPRYDPNSRMPVFAIDGKTTAAKAILEGDAEQQYAAIWAYLTTLKP
ncbi:MAG: DUF6797 domain-containing protein [Planctomycetota bacterium]